jgi:hypothetical protein
MIAKKFFSIDFHSCILPASAFLGDVSDRPEIFMLIKRKNNT